MITVRYAKQGPEYLATISDVFTTGIINYCRENRTADCCKECRYHLACDDICRAIDSVNDRLFKEMKQG